MFSFYFTLTLLLLNLIFSSSAYCQNTYEINGSWVFRQVGTSEWMPAEVPGTIHTDLMANRKIPDPFFRLNEHNLQWIDKEKWEYKTSFSLADEFIQHDRIFLEFLGLDTYAQVFLNDSLILSSDNMFRTYQVDTKKYLKKQNELVVTFDSPIVEGIKKYDALGYTIPVSDNDQAVLGQVEGEKKVSIFTRKAGYHFGWDWGPRLTTSGIWRPIKLKAWNGVNITDLFIKQIELGEESRLEAMVEFEALKDDDSAIIEIHVNDLLVAENQINIKNGLNKTTKLFTIKDPELWWPNGIGEQKMYDIAVKVFTNDQVSESKTRIGLREIHLITQPDKHGTSFYFEVNGQPTFMKGANYIPQDIFLPRVSRDRYERIIQDAVDANMNMLRIWGGGIYEDDYFYQLCNEKGILVWQDFMFACAMFPGDDSFLQNVKQEAIDNVKRLRNHPSIALWCGNNEILAAWEGWGWKQQVIEDQSAEIADIIWKAYTDIFHNILPEVVKEFDPDRPYWASSPSSSLGVKESQTSGDMHYWGVWWGKEPFNRYQEVMPRFMSEFGFQSFPEYESVKKYTLPEDHDVYSDVMKSHQRSSIGNVTIEEYMLRYFKEPKDFPSFLYVSHLLQAYGIQEGMEAHRRNRDYCMGSLYWQINDCWPVASWSSIDYYGKWKALHYAIKRAFNEVILSFESDNDTLKLFAINDGLNGFDAHLKLKVIDFEGEVKTYWNEEVYVDANASQLLMQWDQRILDNFDQSKCLIISSLMQDGEEIASKIYYMAPFKSLSLPEPELTFEVNDLNNRFEVILKANKLAKSIFLKYDSAHNFSDNYFDMIPGSVKTVYIEKDTELSTFKNGLEIMTLLDTY